jgi:hypothetical protein
MTKPKDATATDDSRAIRRYVDDLVARIVATAARRYGKDDVLSVIGTAPAIEHPGEAVNSL